VCLLKVKLPIAPFEPLAPVTKSLSDQVTGPVGTSIGRRGLMVKRSP